MLYLLTRGIYSDYEVYALVEAKYLIQEDWAKAWKEFERVRDIAHQNRLSAWASAYEKDRTLDYRNWKTEIYDKSHPNEPDMYADPFIAKQLGAKLVTYVELHVEE